jgi:soluble lytic murein transglycosylase-like protein
MRALLAAKAIAAALVLVPIQARLEPLAFAVESEFDADALSHTTAAQPDQSPQDAALDALEPAPFSGWDGENDANAVAASLPPDSAGSVGMSADAICAALDRSASQNKLPLDFFTRLIWQESRFNPLSVSRAGAQGIAQFMPGTAHRVGLVDPFDPIEALPKSAELLHDLRTQFGNLGLAAAAYNAGSKRVEDWLAKRKLLPPETEAYVRIITGRSAQEWTSAEAGTWDAALPAPAPCAQLAKPVPYRSQPAIAIRQPDRPAHPMVVAHQPDRPVTAAHQPESIRCCGSPVHGVKLAHLASSVCPQECRCCPEERSRTRAPDRLVLRTRLDRGSFACAPARTARHLAPASDTGPARGSTGVNRGARNRSMQICLMLAGGSLMDGEGCSSTSRLARAGESLQSRKSRARGAGSGWGARHVLRSCHVRHRQARPARA